MSLDSRRERAASGNWSGSTSFTRKLKGDWWKAKLCTACVSPLGRILSRGGHCPQCGLRVCKNCRYYLDGGDQNQENVATTNGGSNHPGWICILCSGSAPRAPSSSLPRSAFGKAGAKSIRRSWTISNPPRGNDQENNSPVLKSFIMYNDDTVIGLNSPNTRQFNSLPRLTYGIKLQDLQTPRSERAADRRFSYSTLYPFKNNKTKSTSSVNFIEDPFWDYYDYNIINSNRSSCERSLGDVEYCSYIIDPADNIKLNPGTDILARDPTSNHDSKTLPKSVPPKKPDRPSKRSNSLNSYDQKHLLAFSPLRTYVVLRQPTPTSTPSTNAVGSGGSTKKRSSSFNLDLQSGPKRNRGGDGRDNDMGYAEAKTPLREYHLNCNQVFEEEFQARAMTTAPPVLKPKRFFSSQDQVVFPSSEELKPHTFQSTPVQGENMQRRSASAMGGEEGLDKGQIRDRERDAQWLNNIRAEINSAYAFNSLPSKRKGKVTVTSPVALSPDDFKGERSSNAIKTASNHHHIKLARSNSVDDKPLSKQAKYFFDHRIDSPVKTTSPIPKPPRKSIAPPLPTGLPTGSLQPRELVFPDSGSEGSRRGGGHETIIPIIAEDGYAKEPEIDPKLQELLKKSEIILNATLTTSSLINSPPTIEGNVNVVQITPTQVHTFPRRGKHHVTTTVPVTATSPGSNPTFASNYSSMSSSLDRRIGPKKDFYKQAVKVNVNGAGSPSSAEFVSSTSELVVEEVLCTDDEDERSNVAWLSVKGKESGKNQPSYTKNSNFNHKSDLDQQPHPHLSDHHHHHQPHHHPQFSRTCEQNENLDNSNSLLLLGRGINSVKNARKKSQGELMSTPQPHASQSQEGTTTTTTSLGVEHSKSRSMHDRKQDAATVGGSTWVYKHVPEEDYVRRSQVCNNTQILFNEHEENGGGGALVRPTRNESGSRNSNHSNCTSSSNPTVPSTNNCSKLSDLNNPQQYAPVTPTRDSKSPNFSAPTSPRSDDTRPGNRGKNLRIIKGRLSNEFVTTVQISSSDPLDEPQVTPIVRISNHSQSSNNVQVVPVLESSEFGAGTRKNFTGNQGQFEQREGLQVVNLGRPVGQGGNEQVICVTSKNGRAIPDTELGEEREAKEERALPSAPVKDDKEQGFNLCEARVHSLQETDHLTTKVSHAHESKPVAAANVGVLLNGFHSVSTVASPGLGEQCVLNSQNSLEKHGTDELGEPPIPLIKACRSPDIPDFRSSTSTEDTTSTADTIIDFLESQANIDTEGSDTDAEETSFLDNNEYGALTQDSSRGSTGGEPRLLTPSVQHSSGGTGAGIFAIDAGTVEERVVVVDIANHGLESSIHECQSASCERAQAGANGVELISEEHVQEKVDQVSEASSTTDDISSCTSSVIGIDHEQPPSKTPSVVDTEADECDTDDGIIEERLDKSLENLSDISTVPIRSENLLEYLHNLTLNIQRNNCKNSGNNTQTNELTAKHSDILSELAQVPELQYCNENETKGLSENNKIKHGTHEERVREVTNHGVNSSVMEHHERLTPEGQESFTDDSSSTTKRSSPDGEAIQDVKLTRMEEEAFQVTSSDSDNSWIEEIPYEEEGPPPLDLTLHTIVEESCEESADESEKSLRMGRKPLDELENYFNYLDPAQSRNVSRKLANEDSEFSDTFSESSFHSEGNQNQEEDNSIDPVDLASTRLEKYFTNLGYSKPIPPPPNHHISAEEDSEDSVGSESECDDHLQDKKKKVFKHKRSANVSDDESMIFDLDEGAYDTIKRSKKKSNSTQHNNSSSVAESNHGSQGSVTGGGNGAQTKGADETDGVKGPQEVRSAKEEVSPSVKPKQVLLNRSNSFQWSSDEEVNLMMSKLRQLVKGLMQKGQSVPAESNAQLRYFETELIRLMRSEPELKNIVSEYISSEESDDNEFNQFIKEVVQQQDEEGSAGPERNQYPYSSYSSHDSHGSHRQFSSKLPKDIGGPSGSGTSPASPALIAKVMHHIGNRLSVWMKDEDEEGTLKCAPSVSSDLNEDRFSWKGSFESTLAAKRQSVGSTDSISSSDLNNQLSQAAGTGSGVDRSILRSSSLHHLANSQPIEEKKEEEENISNSLPRLNQVTHMPRAQSLLGIGKEKVKSARYRPPGFTQTSSSIKPMNDKMSVSTPALHQDIMPDTPPMNLRGSDSIISVYEPGLSQVNVRGQIEFSLQYNYKLAALEVKVKQCRDLAAVDTKRHRSDPYVKAYLLPDKSKSGKRKTKTKKNTLNPIFEETLKFPITLSELQSRTLWVSVWHSDIFGKNEFLGQVIIPLKDRIFDEPSPIWWQLEEMTDQVDERPRGDIIIALKWQARTDSTGNLSILVKEAKNLLPVKSGMPSTFVKCCPLKESKSSHRSKQKTSIARRTLHPIWNQTLYFEDVADDGVEITLWNHDLLSNHDLIGMIKLDQNVQLWESMLNRHSFWVEGVLKLEAEH